MDSLKSMLPEAVPGGVLALVAPPSIRQGAQNHKNFWEISKSIGAEPQYSPSRLQCAEFAGIYRIAMAAMLRFPESGPPAEKGIANRIS